MATYLNLNRYNIFDHDISPADPNVLYGYELTVLQKCVLSPEFDPELMRRLINNGNNLEARNYSGKTAFHLAVINRAKDKVEFLIENGADVQAKDHDGNNALHFIALAELNYHFENINSAEESIFLKPAMFRFDDTYSILERLLKEGVEVNARNYTNDTPLMWASRGRHLEIVKKLLAFGANVYLENEFFETCLHFATQNNRFDRMARMRYDENYIEILSELVRNKACVNCGAIRSVTPLGKIIHSRHDNKLKFAEELIKLATLWNWERKIEFYVTANFLRLGESRDEIPLKNYADDCYEEIVAMKIHILPEGYNLCEFACGGVTEEVLRRAPEIKEEVLKILVRERFPKYRDLILDRMGRLYFRRKARNLNVVVRGSNIHLNPDIMHCISSYLNNEDILKLLAEIIEQSDQESDMEVE
ncbi:unnamed protein product [Larinioides sclopetarius]|uniref:Ankyrin repeat protein n=1 Tax=Larinioides sclopetarius TaxID=280406 RepID=A0AAV2BYT4_9ARAC